MNRDDLSNLAFLIQSVAALPTPKTLELADRYMDSTDEQFLRIKEILRKLVEHSPTREQLKKDTYTLRFTGNLERNVADSLLWVLEKD